jgi:hypothetical protein
MDSRRPVNYAVGHLSWLMAKKQLTLGLTFGLLILIIAVTTLIYPAQSLGFWWTVFFWLFFWFIYYLPPAALMSSPFWIFGRRRARWIWWEFAILIVPYIVWVACLFINKRGKGLQNVLEMFWLGCTVPLAAIVRVLIGSRVNRKVVASSLIAIYSVAAIVLWAVVAPMARGAH